VCVWGGGGGGGGAWGGLLLPILTGHKFTSGRNVRQRDTSSVHTEEEIHASINHCRTWNSLRSAHQGRKTVRCNI